MKTDWKLIVVAFGLGILLGVVAAGRCAPQGFHGGWRNPETFHQRLMEKFTAKLHLTADERQKISAILEDTRAKMTALRTEIRPRFEEIRNSSRSRIREILTPEQQQKFDAMNTEMDARFEKYKSRRF